MRWGGVILAGFLVFHLLQFTAQVVTTGFRAGASPYDMVIAASQQVVDGDPGLRRLGGRGVPARPPRRVERADHAGREHLRAARSFLNGLAWVIAVVLFVGFMIMPLAVLFGWVN